MQFLGYLKNRINFNIYCRELAIIRIRIRIRIRIYCRQNIQRKFYNNLIIKATSYVKLLKAYIAHSMLSVGVRSACLTKSMDYLQNKDTMDILTKNKTVSTRKKKLGN